MMLFITGSRRRVRKALETVRSGGASVMLISMLTFRLLPLGLATVLLLAQAPPKQKPETINGDEPIKVDVNLVNVLASVRSKQGAYINTLTKNDFELTEEGRKQTIKYFS